MTDQALQIVIEINALILGRFKHHGLTLAGLLMEGLTQVGPSKPYPTSPACAIFVP
jgi:hypothetical protein